MLDFLQPIMLVFLSNWDWGKTEGATPLLAKSFWCFDAFLRNTNQIPFLETVSHASKAVVKRIRKLLKKVAPVVWVWLRLAGLEKLIWMHSDLALMYKRAFKNVWPFWLQIHCSPDPSQWLPYLATAFIIVAFTALLELPDPSLSAVGEAFPRILWGANVPDVGKIAWWLWQAMPMKEKDAAAGGAVAEPEFFAPR
jgi:hypothetical protein